ncbi:NADPH-dependent 1-acyl dihydroxyacetone phosphate reductase, partial [Friedmanniomyces endolithicus]
MESLTSLGIETLPLDIQSESSINDCAKKISRLDILINNAGAANTMPIADLSIPEARKLFDSNVWGHIAITQAFLPLLLKSPKAIVVNHTSVGAGLDISFQAVYNPSKAAMFSEILRLELQPFGILVVELRTGGVKTNVVKNVRVRQPKLPEGSIYTPAKELIERALAGEGFEGLGITAE